MDKKYVYAIKKKVPDKILKTKFVEVWKIFRGFGEGRYTVFFGPHCLTDEFEVASDFAEMEKCEVVTYIINRVEE